MLEIDSFLTAYEPSDLPGTSIDPLGFERGYLFLADKILPGLTNVAAQPALFRAPRHRGPPRPGRGSV